MRLVFLVTLLAATPAAADTIVPNLFAEAGTITHWFVPRVDTTATIARTDYRVMTAPGGEGAAAIGGEARVGLALGPHVLLGAELEAAGILSSPITAARTTDGAVERTNATLAGMTGFVGARFPLGAVELTGELHGGFRDLVVGAAPGHLTTERGSVIDARIRAELFVHHGLAVAAFVGSAVTETDLVGGVSLIFYNCRPDHASLAGCRRP